MSHISGTDVATQLFELITDRDWVKNATSEQMMRLRREMEVEYARETEAQAASAAKVARIVQTGLSVLDQLAEVRKEQEDEGDFDTDSPDDSPMEDENGDNTKDDGEVQVRDEVEGHAKDEGEGEEVKGEVKRQ